ncbi:MAG TPA: hydrogenase maturation protease, partial [Frankiaceae bacterium]|nr:hydrogenase maturation protease [Frankiaceae bacterium]
LGLSLLPEIADRVGLLLLDAVVGGRTTAGEVMVLAGEQVRQARSVLVSAHQIGVGEALAAAELAGCAPGRVAAVGIVPASLDTGYGLSPAVAGKLDTLVDRALDVLAGWGVPVAADA